MNVPLIFSLLEDQARTEVFCFPAAGAERKSALVIVSFNATLRQERFIARVGIESSVSQPLKKKKKRHPPHRGVVQGK